MEVVNIENYYNLLNNWDHCEYLCHEYALMYLVLNNYSTRRAAEQYALEVPRHNRNASPNNEVFERLRNRMMRYGCLKPNHQYGGRFERVCSF